MKSIGIMVERGEFVPQDRERLLRLSRLERLEELLLPHRELDRLSCDRVNACPSSPGV